MADNAPARLTVWVMVRDKEIEVSCGEGTQRVKWLGHVGIARYDEESFQGWKQLGVPTGVFKFDRDSNSTTPLMMGQTIRECLEDGDRVKVETSSAPSS